MTRILVTGASGFVGRALLQGLTHGQHESPYSIRAAARREQSVDAEPAIQCIVHGDLSVPVDWSAAVDGIDTVVHLAGVAHTHGADAMLHDRVNRLATADLAAAAARAGVRHFIFVSSVRAQCGASAEHVLTETDTPAPADDYGRSKLAAEQAVQAAAVPFTILRPVLVYGPGMKGNLAALLRLARSPLPLPLKAFTNRRSLLNIGSLVDAIEFSLQTSATIGQVYLVAERAPVSLADLVGALRTGLGRDPHLVPVPPALLNAVLHLSGRADLWQRIGGELVVDPGKLIEAGWSPTADSCAALIDAVRQTAQKA